MKKWLRLAFVVVAAFVIAALVVFAVLCNQFADIVIHNPATARVRGQHPEDTPRQHLLTDYVDVALTADDGLRLAAWYFPARNRAAVILLHGYKQARTDMLSIAAMLVRHGYGALVPDLREHGQSAGEQITFGRDEMRDVEAAYQYIVARPEVDRARIGLLGDSMGSVTAILYAARNPAIRAVVAQSPYTTPGEMVSANVKRLGLPAFPFAPTILFLVERQLSLDVDTVAPVRQISRISPRAVFILMGGRDTWVNPEGGRQLYAAAGEPRESWFDPELGHLEFHEKRPAEFEKRIAAFFEEYLLNQ